MEKYQFHFRTLLYFVITIKILHQFCNVFRSSTAMLFIKRRINKLRICAPSLTKYSVFTFYSPPAGVLQPPPSLNNFQLFFPNTILFHSEVDSNESSNVLSWFHGFLKFSHSITFHVNTFFYFGVAANLVHTAPKLKFSIIDFSSIY